MGPAIADTEEVIRYCSPMSFDDDGRCAAAFWLKTEKNEEYLSVFWLGCQVISGEDRASRIASCRAAVAAAGALRPAATGKYAVLSVGRSRSEVNRVVQRWIPFTEEAAGFPPFHAGIHDTATDELIVADVLQGSIEALVPAK